MQTPLAPPPGTAKHTKAQILAIVERYPKVRDWLVRYPRHDRIDEEDYDSATTQWTVKIWQGRAGQIVQAKVDDPSGVVITAYTGRRSHGGWRAAHPGAFGGKWINDRRVWGGFCLVFLLGLADLRRPFSLRNLDLLMLLSPTASLYFFNHGDVFTSVPLFYPALLWVVVRGVWIGATGRATNVRALWPAWVLLAATCFLGGFKIMLNVEASNVIDVGYSGVIGAQRIVHGEAPWGNFPIEGDLKACGPADASGETRERIQTNGRCESANPQGDTYGPVAYESYIPGTASSAGAGSGTRSRRRTSPPIAFDLLCILGLWLVGRALRRHPVRRDACVRMGGVSVHAVRVELEHERRDHARASSSGASGS